MSEEKKVRRAQFDFSPETWDLVEKLRLDINASSKAEVMRRAIALYAWYMQEVKVDDVVDIKNKEGTLLYRMTGKFFRF